MTKNVALLVFVLLIGAEHFAHAQTGWSNPFAPPPAEPRPAQTFKTGDYVDVQLYGQWIPGGPATVLPELPASLAWRPRTSRTIKPAVAGDFPDCVSGLPAGTRFTN